jgi:hypothetical protein
VNGDVESKQFNKCRVVSKAQEISEIMRVVLGRINIGQFSLDENVVVYASGYVGKFSDPVKAKNEISRGETEFRIKTHRSMQSSNVGSQYSCLGMPS